MKNKFDIILNKKYYIFILSATVSCQQFTSYHQFGTIYRFRINNMQIAFFSRK
jgi:hypothetical protein